MAHKRRTNFSIWLPMMNALSDYSGPQIVQHFDLPALSYLCAIGGPSLNQHKV